MANLAPNTFRQCLLTAGFYTITWIDFTHRYFAVSNESSSHSF
jgi:hypothetical protein